jgi:lipoprotein-anchoring transpeptidase ErfK/SrfK
MKQMLYLGLVAMMAMVSSVVAELEKPVEPAKVDSMAQEHPPLMPHTSSSTRSNPDARILKKEKEEKAKRQAAVKIYKQDWAYIWTVDETKPVTRLEVRISDQIVNVYQGDILAGYGPISTGKEGHGTPVGKYEVLQKEKDHKSNLYGSFVNAQGKMVNSNAEVGDKVPEGLRYMPSPMPFFLRLTWEGVGLHQGFLPGYPASHGCIRLPRSFAEKLFSVVEKGTPVEVVP